MWSKVLKSPNAARPNEENCNNVCGVGEITLKVEYSDTNFIVNALKLKKELFSVTFMWLGLISRIVLALCKLHAMLV